MSKNKDPTKERKPFIDVDGVSLKFCQTVEILNGVVPPGHVAIGKMVKPGPWESTIEYNEGRSIENIENKKLKIRINVRIRI